MMGGLSPVTCWTIKKHWNNKFYYTVASCRFFLWVLYYDARIHEHQVFFPETCLMRVVRQQPRSWLTLFPFLSVRFSVVRSGFKTSTSFLVTFQVSCNARTPWSLVLFEEEIALNFQTKGLTWASGGKINFKRAVSTWQVAGWCPFVCSCDRPSIPVLFNP